MGFEHDDLAGVVDLFGALTRGELTDALFELAFKRDWTPDEPAEHIRAAVVAYRLVAFEQGDGSLAAVDADALGDRTLLAPGPTAFPRLPDGATDLPHILDVPTREFDRAALGAVLEERFRADVARAVAADDAARMAELLDLSYDIEAWGPVELRTTRERLDAALGGEADANATGTGESARCSSDE